MHPLLAERTPEQVALLDTIYEGRQKIGVPNYKLDVDQATGRPRWPTFQYIERTLQAKHSLDAVEVLATCPVVRGTGGAYGWVWHAEPQSIALTDASRVALTVAGMGHIAEAEEEVRLFLDALRVLVVNEAGFIPRPEEADEVRLTREALETILRAEEPHWDLGPRSFEWLTELLAREPATWHTNYHEDQEGDPGAYFTLSRFLRSYRSISTAEEYVNRVVEVYTPPVPAPEPLHPSSLSLPEAIDYLNTVWRLRHDGNQLLKLGRVEVAAKLALDCVTADEFEARISALSSVLDGMAIPGAVEGGKLFELKNYLAAELSEEASQRTSAAVDDLKAVIDLRVWRQHSGTHERGAQGAQRLGIALPPADWNAAWKQVQARTVGALSALREEIEQLGN